MKRHTWHTRCSYHDAGLWLVAIAAQTHEGCVFMDFSKHWFDARGYGECVSLRVMCACVCGRLRVTVVGVWTTAECVSLFACRYTRLSVDALPPLFLAYTSAPKDSGKVHSPVKQRWLDGDQQVIAALLVRMRCGAVVRPSVCRHAVLPSALPWPRPVDSAHVHMLRRALRWWRAWRR